MHVLMAAPPPLYHQLYFQHFQGMADNRLILFFVWIIIFDIITGFAKSIITHHTTSRKGTQGLIKHGVLLLIILTLYPMLDVNGMRTAADTFVTFYCLFYGVSIIENLGQMGVPLPGWVKKYVYKLSDDYNNERKSNHNDHTN